MEDRKAFQQQQQLQISNKKKSQKSQSSAYDNFETEEEFTDEPSPLGQIFSNHALTHRNPLLSDKGNAQNGRILTEGDGQFKFNFNSNKDFEIQNSLRQLSNNKKQKKPKKQVSNMALKEDLMPQKNKVKREISQSLRNFDEQHHRRKEEQKYTLYQKGEDELTLNPKKRISSLEDLLLEESHRQDHYSSDSSRIVDPITDLAEEEHKEEDENNYQKEMNQLIKIETKFFHRQSNNNLRVSVQSLNQQYNQRDRELIRTETADFPMKLLTHALISIENNGVRRNNLNQLSNQDILQDQNQEGTPRFPTDEEIEQEELKMLLTFAFKDTDEIE